MLGMKLTRRMKMVYPSCFIYKKSTQVCHTVVSIDTLIIVAFLLLLSYWSD